MIDTHGAARPPRTFSHSLEPGHRAGPFFVWARGIPHAGKIVTI